MKPPSPNPSPELPEEKCQLQFQRYVKLCQQNVAQTEDARRWLSAHGLDDHSLFERYAIGWSAGNLAEKLPSDPKVRTEFRITGLLDEKDHEPFANHAVFTIFGADGRIQDLWAVAADGSQKFLPRRPRGVLNFSVTKHTRHVFAVANPVALLLLASVRYTAVVAVEPEAGTVDVDALKARGVQRVTVVAGDTPTASSSARVLVARFTGLPCDVAVLPGAEGIRDFVKKHGLKSLAEAVAVATAGLHEADIPNFLPTPDGFRLRIDTREYFALRLTRAGLHLKTTLRAHCRNKIHLDTLDLYAARMRKEFIREAARIFEEPPKNLEEDMPKVLAAAEKRAAQPDLSPPDAPVDPVPEGLRKEAELFGRSPDLLTRIREDLGRIGVEGEDIGKTIAYLGMTSRLLPQPLAIKIQGPFGSGKSKILAGAAALCPPEQLQQTSYLSGKALLHMASDELRQKLLTLAEAAGAEDSAYLLRELISSGRLVARYTSRDPASGRLFTETKCVEGPTAVMLTTSDQHADEETDSRFIVICSDESPEQTDRILRRQRENLGLSGLRDDAAAKNIRALHHAFQRLLQPLRVVFPENLELPECGNRLGARRDNPKIANLISAIALLRQMQKAVKQEGGGNYIEADMEDVKLATPLIDAVFRRSMREMTDTSRNLLQAIHEFRAVASGPDQPREAFTFTMRQLREYTQLPQTTLHRSKEELELYELLVRDASTRRRPYRYWLDWAPTTHAVLATA